VQFVDPLILMRVVRNEAHRRIVFLIAEKSMRRKVIGFFAALVGAVPVGRALDSTKTLPGRIYLPDPDNDPLLVRGVRTDFEAKDFQIGGLLVLPNVNHSAANAEILEIRGPEEIRLKKPFKGNTAIGQLTGRTLVVPDGETKDSVQKSWPNGEFNGTPFKVAPKVDQTKVYDAVFEKLNDGGCVGIFPEGGSHDRTELLPLKGNPTRNKESVISILMGYSWCRHYGSWCTCRKSRLRTHDYPVWDELLSCAQIPITSSRGIWHPNRSAT
jgi:glycerol-3-phosphate O-acyltransferase / dihydroxyacetone phosphate acyltransferase